MTTATASPARAIRCGHCKASHGSVSEVRACSARAYSQHQSITGRVYSRTPAAEIVRMTREQEIASRSQHYQAPADVAPEVPAGRYALVSAEGEVKFYRVDRPTEGRWAGYVFVKVQAGDEYWSLKNREMRERVLAEISADVQGAMLRYGREIGQCGHCGRTLTNDESRERGIGPICAGRMGW